MIFLAQEPQTAPLGAWLCMLVIKQNFLLKKINSEVFLLCTILLLEAMDNQGAAGEAESTIDPPIAAVYTDDLYGGIKPTENDVSFCFFVINSKNVYIFKSKTKL